MRNYLILVSFIGILSGCVSTSAHMLDDRRMMLSGNGSAFSSSPEVFQDILRTAAAEGQRRGFSSFRIVGSKDTTTINTYIAPVTSQTSLLSNTNCYGSFCNSYGQANTTTSGGSASDIILPGMDAYVEFYREGEVPAGTPGVWVISAILANMQK